MFSTDGIDRVSLISTSKSKLKRGGILAEKKKKKKKEKIIF